MTNSTLLRSTILRKGFTRRNLSSVGIRPTTWAIVKSQSKHDLCTSIVVNDTVSSSMRPQHRWMSDSGNSRAAADALINIIDREHTKEVKGISTGIPEALTDLHNVLTEVEGWKIVTDDETTITKLSKTIDAVKVQVCFHCQNATERVAGQKENMEDTDNADDAQGEDEYPSVRCTISVTKGSKTLFMVCIAQDYIIRIQSTAMAGEVTDIDALHASGVNANLYRGPKFTTLTEDLQDAFHAYVEDYLGVRDDVVVYGAMQFDYNKQCQYVKFLGKTKNLVA